jgi:hypothetical protein
MAFSRNAPRNRTRTAAQVAAPPIAAKNNGHIKRDRPSMQILELGRQDFPFILVSAFERLARRLHAVADPQQPGREHVEQRSDARQQEDRRQRHLDDVRNIVESRSLVSTPSIGLLLHHPRDPTRGLDIIRLSSHPNEQYRNIARLYR